MMQSRELTDDEWTIAIPFRLEFLFRIYTHSAHYPDTDTTNAVWIKEFHARGLLAHNEEYPQLSDRGEKLIKMILATPLPSQVWVDPRKEKQ